MPSSRKLSILHPDNPTYDLPDLVMSVNPHCEALPHAHFVTDAIATGAARRKIV